MTEEDKKTKILGMRISTSDHRILKVEAAKRDMTIKEFIFEAVKKYLQLH